MPDMEMDDKPIESTAKMRDASVQRKRNRFIAGVFIVALVALLLTGNDPVRVIIAVVSGFAILMLGMTVLGAMSRPVPEPPPPGELRRVRLKYRCSICGAEIKMTLANDQVPEPPRHCGELMEVVPEL